MTSTDQPTTPDLAAITAAIKAFPFWNYGLDDVKPNSEYAEWVPDLAAAIHTALNDQSQEG